MSRVIKVDNPLQVTLTVIRVFDQLEVPYVIGGSLASSVHGVARATRDADIVAAMREPHVRPLVEALKKEFYVSEDAVREAVARRGSFNLIHLASNFKVDIFVKPSGAFADAQFDRRAQQPVTPDAQQAFVSSAEDIILNKLVWYRQGGGVSDRQWNDIIGVLKVQGSRLDLPYLKQWAATLGVTELLERALTDIGPTR